MRSALDTIAYWLIDYFAAATVLLLIVGAAQRAIKQPARRLALHWGTLIGLAVLVFLCVLPGWPRIDITGVARAIPESWSEPTLRVSSPSVDPGDGPLEPAPVDSPVTRFSGQPSFESPGQSALLSPEVSRVAAPSEAAAVVPVPRVAPLPSAPATFWHRLSNYDLGPFRIFALAIFTLGCVLTAFRVIHGVFAARRVRLTAARAPRSVVAELQKLVGKRPCPDLLVSRSHPIPIVIGALRPKILLPPQFAETERPDDCRSVLAHELAHIQNGDLWLLTLDRWLLPLFWMHPLYLRLRRSLRDDQELLADSFAASHSSRTDYADMLVRWARRLVAEKQARQLAAAVGVWDRPTRLHDRISRLLHPSQRLELCCPRVWRMGSLLALIALPTLLSTATVRPQAPSLFDFVASWPTHSSTTTCHASCSDRPCSASPANPANQYLREQSVIAEVLRLGGSIKTVRTWTGSFVSEVDLSLQETRGGDRVENEALIKEALPDLAAFGHLKVLALAGGQVTDCGLRKISALKELESVTLKDARLLRGAGVAELAKLPRMRRLELRNGRFGNAALGRLGTMPSLEELAVEGSNLSQEVVEIAARMPNLQSLSLDLPKSPIGRKAVLSLHALPKLKRLSLHCSEIADDALLALSSLTNLRSLSLGDSHVSPHALAVLRRSLPGLAVQTARQTVRVRSAASLEQTQDDAPHPAAGSKSIRQFAGVSGALRSRTVGPSVVRPPAVCRGTVCAAGDELRTFVLRIHPSLTKVEWTLSFADSKAALGMSSDLSIRIDAHLVFKCRLRRVGSDWKIEQCEVTLTQPGVEKRVERLATVRPQGQPSEEWLRPANVR
jgi:hypothetical protein